MLANAIIKLLGQYLRRYQIWTKNENIEKLKIRHLFSRSPIKNRENSKGERKITKEIFKITVFMEVGLSNQEISKRMGRCLHHINAFCSNPEHRQKLKKSLRQKITDDKLQEIVELAKGNVIS
ncbi:hypothetical protein RF11_14317 [Thelohanellus kitauei]|uniref:Uncharacterized protein n=1 Tax=Thelohanellus kitauei TaxID=669202 RepID=A0A0C2JEB1_THEKT|nr:hypothetical protein RF11_14317 [Thelohanellus kitauei]